VSSLYKLISYLTRPIEFEINEEVQEMLRHVPGPVGVVSVAGMYRTGKSYLLNRMLLNRAGGFGVGPTINPCTKVSPLIPRAASQNPRCHTLEGVRYSMGDAASWRVGLGA
jgi:hypothetical protein